MKRLFAPFVICLSVIEAGASPALDDSLSRARAVPVCPGAANDLPTARWALDMREKNLTDIMHFFVPNSRFVDPSGRRFAGLGQLRSLHAQVFRAFDSDIEMTPQALTAGDDPHSCVESGIYRETLHDRKAGTDNEVRGNYRFIWQLQSRGYWRLLSQEWTFN